MTNTIYYFTSTGNSLQIAQQIAKKLEDTQLTSMATPPPKNPVGGPNHIIGFVFPVYFFGLPRIVKHFIQNLILAPQTYTFAVINHGGGPFDALGMLNDTLQKKGEHLSYGELVYMPGNYLVRYGSETPETAEEIRKQAQQTVTEVAQAIRNHTLKPVVRNHKLLSKIVNKVIYINIKGFDKKFYATTDCIGCGLCSEICPVQNIKLEDHHPVWQHRCERCMACIHWCPSEAIQYGKNTVKRRRYHNPNVTAKDIIDGNSLAVV